MKKRVASLLCTSRRKNSFDDQLIVDYGSIDETETDSRYRSAVDIYETITRNHRKMKSSAIFIRTFRTFYRRISNGFHRKTQTSSAVVQNGTVLVYGENHESHYETIAWDLLRCGHSDNATEFVDTHLRRLTRRSPPEITWKHSWSTHETRDALLTSPFVHIPTEINLQIFQFLSIRDLANVSLVCRQFKMIADHDVIWKSICHTSNKLISKSFKEIHMDWTYEKYLRNQELEEIENNYSGGYRRISSLITDSFDYPIPSTNQTFFSSIAGFRQHPNSSPEMTIQLSIDIDKTLREFISLLEKASIFQVHWYQQPTIIKQMILRYYRFLKLKVLLPANIHLVPTLDIETIWQTHLSHPQMYRSDCLRLFGRIIDHSLLTDDIGQFLKEQAFIDTCQLYEEQFGEQYCSIPIDRENRERTPKYERVPEDGRHRCLIPIYAYWDETYFDFATELSNDYENPFSFSESDVIADSNWLNSYRSFMFEMRWKISNGDDRFLLENNNELDSLAIKRLKKSYERFLYISAKYPSIDEQKIVHPTYAIDLIWRCHIQEPWKYGSDCLQLVGHLIDRVSWLSMKAVQMTELTDNTNDIWKSEFNHDITTDHLYTTNNNGMVYQFY